MKLYRLQPDDAFSWTLYPVFEARVRSFMAKYCPNYTAQQEKEFFTELRQRWAATPQLAGYWLAIDGEQAVAHVCGWIQQAHGRPYILCFQAECDQMWESRDVLPKVYAEARVWKDEVNAALLKTKADSPIIDFVEQWTFHDNAPEAWNRLLPEIEQKQVLHVMRFSI